MKKIVSVLLCTAAVLALLVTVSFADYENTHVNTGDMAADILAVAQTQIGYMEGSLEGTVQGSNDCTKYGEWYGLNYNPWCAMFVSWCADQAGIPTNVIPCHASCDVGMNWFKAREKWQYSPAYGGQYEPKSSDIIYFGYKYGDEYDSTHVGIVWKTDNERVYVVEGNSSSKVQTVSYKLSSSYILGYGVPAYYVTDPSDNGFKPGKYVVTASALNVRTDPNADVDSEIIGVLKKGDEVVVTEIANDHWGKIDYKGKPGWISLRYCEFIESTDPVFTVTFNANGGSGAPGPFSVKVGCSLTIPDDEPVRNGYVFLGWAVSETAEKAELVSGDEITVDADTVLYAVWYRQKLDHWELNPFSDVPDDAWYYDAVEYCYLNEFMTGVSSDEFAPSVTADRAQFVTVLGKIYISRGGSVGAADEAAFPDVDAGRYYAKYVSWAKENGLVAGDELGNFNPSGKLTREQMALILMRAAALFGYDTEPGDPGSLEAFSDSDECSAWAKEGLAWACSNGLLAGSEGKLMPQGKATRAQTAQIIFRLTSEKTDSAEE